MVVFTWLPTKEPEMGTSSVSFWPPRGGGVLVSYAWHMVLVLVLLFFLFLGKKRGGVFSCFFLGLDRSGVFFT